MFSFCELLIVENQCLPKVEDIENRLLGSPSDEVDGRRLAGVEPKSRWQNPSGMAPKLL